MPQPKFKQVEVYEVEKPKPVQKKKYLQCYNLVTF